MALSGPTRSQDVPKLGNLERTWRAFGSILAIFLDLGRDLPKMSENQKNNDSSSLWEVFSDPGAVLEAKLAHLGAMLGHVGAILEQLGDEMGAPERQDEPRSRPRAPR